MIKEYFANYFLHMSDVTISTGNNSLEVHSRKSESWRITLIDTGQMTSTGGRLKRVQEYLENEERFCFTYGDGIANVDIAATIKFHETSGKLCTLTAVQPPGRYGALERVGNRIIGFREKILGDGGWVNGGYFVAEKEVLNLITGDNIAWEGYPLETLALNNQLQAFEHNGFWHPMDTLRDKNYLESLWESGEAPWKLW